MADIVSSTESLTSKKQKLDNDGGYSQTGEEYLTGDCDAEEEVWCSDDDAYGDTESDEELVDAAAKQKEYYEKHFANLREMTAEECRVYYEMVKQSDGFDVPCFPGTAEIARIDPVLSMEDSKVELEELSNKALEQYNNDNFSGYRLIEVEKANCQVVAGLMYYITFKATDTNNVPEIFQAKVWDQINDLVEIEFCRKKMSATK